MGNGQQHCQVILIQSDCLETDNLLTEPRAFLPDRRIRVRVFQAVTKQVRCSSRRNARTLLSFSPHLPALTIQADIFFSNRAKTGLGKRQLEKDKHGHQLALPLEEDIYRCRSFTPAFPRVRPHIPVPGIPGLTRTAEPQVPKGCSALDDTRAVQQRGSCLHGAGSPLVPSY